MAEKLLFFVLLLGVLVLVHEMGHFLVAKACRVQVLKFSIGFGPELVAWQMGETRYSVSAVPLGGFVRMAGEEDLVERWGGPEAPPIDPDRTLGSRPLWQRSAIMVAGPLFNLILAFVLFTAESLGDSEIVPPVVETVLPGTPAERSDLRTGDRIVAVDGTPVAAFDEIPDLLGPKADGTARLTVLRGGQRLDVDVELRRATERDELRRVVERGRVGIASFRRLPVVAVLDPASPAYAAGLRTLDRVLLVDGAPVARYEDLAAALTAAADRAVGLTVERQAPLLSGGLRLMLPTTLTLLLPASAALTPPALATETRRHQNVAAAELDEAKLEPTRAAARRTLEARAADQRGVTFAGACFDGTLEGSPAAQLELGRGDCVIALDGKEIHQWGDLEEAFAAPDDAVHSAVVSAGTELRTVSFRRQKRDELAPLKRGYSRLVFGAMQPVVFGPGDVEVIHRGLLGAIQEGARRTASWTGLTVMGLGGLLLGQVPFASVGGPIMLFDLAGKTTERGLGYFFSLMAAISITLAVVNLLPVPVLDGGHLLFLLIEAVRRSPPPARVREIANVLGLALLLLLMVAVFRNDIARYWDGIVGAFR